MRRRVEALLPQLEGAIGEEGLIDIAGAILDRLEKNRAKPLELAADPSITLLERDRQYPPKNKTTPRKSPGDRLRRELRRKGIPVISFDSLGV